LKFKKTFYNWLTNRFILIIRSEENFAIKATLSFNYARLIVIAVTFCSVVMVLSFYLITTVLSRWFNPEHLQMETSRRIIVLASKVDSLAYEVGKKDAYIMHFKAIMNNEVEGKQEKNKKGENIQDHASVKIEELSSEDSLLRKKFEDEQIFNEFKQPDKRKFSGIYAYEPVKGVVLERYNLKNGKKGIKISCPEGDKIVNMVDGLVLQVTSVKKENFIFVFSEKHNLIVKYQFEGQVVVKEGELIKGGECIGVTGSESPEVYIETRYEGRLVNPENFVQL
jgi:murein DD-endopeptidase MepM/ murein hydrolase activator NlpD